MAKTINTIVGDETYKYENIIIIFSDMINEDAKHRMDFRNFGNLTEKEVEDKLETYQTENQIPDLQNARIIVSGVTMSKNEKKNANEQIKNVRSFWDAYFQKANAHIYSYSSNEKSHIEELMQEP